MVSTAVATISELSLAAEPLGRAAHLRRTWRPVHTRRSSTAPGWFIAATAVLQLTASLLATVTIKAEVADGQPGVVSVEFL